MVIGSNAGFESFAINPCFLLARVSANNASESGGAQSASHRFQQGSSERSPSDGMPRSFANHTCPGMDCSSHCSKSLAS